MINIVLFQNNYKEIYFFENAKFPCIWVLKFHLKEKIKNCKQIKEINSIFLFSLKWIPQSKLFLRSEYGKNIYTKCLWRQFVLWKYSSTICPDNVAKKMVKHFNFLQEFTVLNVMLFYDVKFDSNVSKI